MPVACPTTSKSCQCICHARSRSHFTCFPINNCHELEYTYWKSFSYTGFSYGQVSLWGSLFVRLYRNVRIALRVRDSYKIFSFRCRPWLHSIESLVCIKMTSPTNVFVNINECGLNKIFTIGHATRPLSLHHTGSCHLIPLSFSPYLFVFLVSRHRCRPYSSSSNTPLASFSTSLQTNFFQVSRHSLASNFETTL